MYTKNSQIECNTFPMQCQGLTWMGLDNCRRTNCNNVSRQNHSKKHAWKLSQQNFKNLVKWVITIIRREPLTHWGRVTHICVVKLTIIGSDNGLSPGRRQAIIWTNAGILLIGPLGTKFIEILIGIQKFSFKKMHLKVSSAKWRRFCLGLNVLTTPRHEICKVIDAVKLLCCCWWTVV